MGLEVRNISQLSGLALTLCVMSGMPLGAEEEKEDMLNPDKTAIFFEKEEAPIQSYDSVPVSHRWSPSEEQVARAEAIIVNQLKEQYPSVAFKFDSYYMRQYYGIGFENKGNVIYGNFFCDARGENWHKEPVRVRHGGGDCFFWAMVDLDAEECINISVNGDA